MSKQSFTTGQVLTAAQVNSLQANDYNQSVSVKTASYTLAAADKGTRIEFNTSGSVTCTVNSGLFDAGDTLVIQNRGAGTATVTAGTATVNTSASLVVKQYDSGVLYFVSDSSAIYFASDAADTPLTTKGDLFTFSTAADRIAVGNNGETLVADSSATTGLRYQSAYNGNSIINGAMDIWQRGTTFTTTSGVAYTVDRWASHTIAAGGSVTTSRQTVSDTTNLPTIQYATKFQRVAGNTNTGILSFFNTLESADSYRFAGQTATLSFYAKKGADYSAASSILVSNVASGTGTDEPLRTFTGIVNRTQNNTLTTTWQRFTQTVSITATATEVGVQFYFTPVGTAGADDSIFITGVQLELGSVATTFKRSAGGTLAGELAACQRYCINYPADGAFNRYGGGLNYSTTKCNANIALPVEMRTTPSLTTTGTASNYAVNHGSDTVTACSAVPAINGAGNSKKVASVDATVASGLTAGSFGVLLSNNNNTSYLLFTAEL